MWCIQLREEWQRERAELKSQLQALENDVRVAEAQLQQAEVCSHISGTDGREGGRGLQQSIMALGTMNWEQGTADQDRPCCLY